MTSINNAPRAPLRRRPNAVRRQPAVWDAPNGDLITSTTQTAHLAPGPEMLEWVHHLRLFRFSLGLRSVPFFLINERGGVGERGNRIQNNPFFMQIYSLEVVNYRQVRS